MGPGREAVDAAALLDGFSACLSGLGLPLARQLVEAHGGTLRLESEPGQGTRAIIELP